jgi:DNA-3-methyladenine glycosylase I
MDRQHQAPWECIYRKEERSDCKPGKRPKSDQKYFEILCLCLLQAGLNWGSTRKHWRKYKEGFCQFDISRLSRARASVLLKDPHVIKNSRKVEAIIHNAKEFQKIRREFGSFLNFLKTFNNLPRREEIFKLLSKKFKHIGPYTVEYYLHSVGYWK